MKKQAVATSTDEPDDARPSGVKGGEWELDPHQHTSAAAAAAAAKKKKRTKHNKKRSEDKTGDATTAVDALDMGSLSLSVTRHLGTQHVNAKLDGGVAVTVKDVPHTVHTILPESHLNFNPSEIRVSLPASTAAAPKHVEPPKEPAAAMLLHKKTHSTLSMTESVLSRSPSPSRSPTLLSRDVSVTPPLIDRHEPDTAASAPAPVAEKKKNHAVIVDSSTVNKHKPSSLYNNIAGAPEFYPQYPAAYPVPAYSANPALYHHPHHHHPVSYDTTPALMPYPYMVSSALLPPPPAATIAAGQFPGAAAAGMKDVDVADVDADIPEDAAMQQGMHPMMMAPPSYMHGPQFAAYYPYDPTAPPAAYSYQYSPY